MDKTLVSVIIPVFNASSYLEQTFSQLHNQTLSNFEVIFVDDCSTDNSVYMLKQFCERDPRFNFIEHSENSGCGIARNSGIKIAKGEYIMCLDADDKFSKQLGYKIGIDDYVVKPFDLDELVLKVGAILRRTSIKSNEELIQHLYNVIEPNYKGSLTNKLRNSGVKV